MIYIYIYNIYITKTKKSLTKPVVKILLCKSGMHNPVDILWCQVPMEEMVPISPALHCIRYTGNTGNTQTQGSTLETLDHTVPDLICKIQRPWGYGCAPAPTKLTPDRNVCGRQNAGRWLRSTVAASHRGHGCSHGGET